MKKKIIILHGWNLNGGKYKELVHLLDTSGYQVYTPDLPGFGKGKPLTRPYTLEDYCRFLEEYMRKKGIARTCLIGHSFGGRVALKFTGGHQEMVEKLILTGVPGFAPVSGAKIYFFMVLSKMGRIIFSLPGLCLFQEFARKILYKTARAKDYMLTSGAIRETFKIIIREKLDTYMKELDIPVLLLWGEKDGIVPLSVARKMGGIIEKSKLVIIPEAKHAVAWTNPQEFANQVVKFIEK